jgi:glycosyltransferase involved in cell wall biosynthesis
MLSARPGAIGRTLLRTLRRPVGAIHQLVSAAAPHDATAEQALKWRGLLRGWGFESEIVAEDVHPDLKREVRTLDRAGRRLVSKGDGLVLHYTIWSAAAEVALGARRQFGLCYHNITPGELLREFNPRLAALCDRGREALPRFRGRVAPLIAVSSFNALELRDVGLGEAAVVPLLLELPDAVPRREPSTEPVVVSVGRLVPNKWLEQAIKAFALYQRRHAPGASLVLVGPYQGWESYHQALSLLVTRVGARRVFFTGQISAEARDAWYRRADAYLSLSVHEGFCAPLIEALSHGVPVVANDAGAMPETLGGAGLVVDGSDLALVAEALHELTSSSSTRALLYDAADRRLAELRPEMLAPRVRAALGPLLDGTS